MQGVRGLILAFFRKRFRDVGLLIRLTNVVLLGDLLCFVVAPPRRGSGSGLSLAEVATLFRILEELGSSSKRRKNSTSKFLLSSVVKSTECHQAGLDAVFQRLS